MDLSQALACLISFSTPAPATPASVATCQAIQQSTELQKKVDLDFHLRQVEADGSTIASSAGAVFLEDNFKDQL